MAERGVPSSIEIIGPLDSGLYGKVFKGRQNPLGRTVAVKVIKPEWAHATDALSHARALARVAPHPNVVTVFDVTTVAIDGIGDDIPAVIMEWIDGQKIGNRLGGPRLTVEEARRIAAGILDGLQHIHSCGMAHGDLNFGNIILLENGTPKIIDIDATKERSLGRLSTTSREGAVNADIDYCRDIVFRLLAHSDLPVRVIGSLEIALQTANILDSIRNCVMTALSAAPLAAEIPAAASERNLLNAEQVFDSATQLVRQNDTLGWKQLLRSIRQQVPAELVAWRARREKGLRLSGEFWRAAVQEACEIMAPATTAALVASDSERSGLVSQNALLDDIMSMAEWERSGSRAMVEMPTFLAYVHHHVVGALLVKDNRQQEAIDLLLTKVSVWPDHEVVVLWQSIPLIGWPGVIDDKCTVAWKFLVEMFARHQWLSKFFVRADEFELGLRSYKAIASLLEYASILGAGGSPSEKRQSLAVPAVFFGPGNDWRSDPHVEAMIARALPNGDVVDRLCAAYGASPKQFRLEWPSWYQQWLANYYALYDSVPAMIRRQQDTQARPLPL